MKINPIFISLLSLLVIVYGHELDTLPTICGWYDYSELSLLQEADDQGNTHHNQGSVIVRLDNYNCSTPEDQDDAISDLLTWCRHNDYDCTIRGTNHTTAGESQAYRPGRTLIIKMTYLNQVLAIDDNSILIQAGMTYRELMDYLVFTYYAGCEPYPFCIKYTYRTEFPVMTYGGNLVLGGFSERQFWQGHVADSVQSARVITGEGDIFDVSPHSNSRLFNASFATLGQCSTITRLNLTMYSQPAIYVRTYILFYGTNYDTMFNDFTNETKFGRFDGVIVFMIPQIINATTGQLSFTYQIQLYKYWNYTAPDTTSLIGDYSENSYIINDLTYYNWTIRLTPQSPTAYMMNLNSVMPKANFSTWWNASLALASNAGGHYTTFVIQMMLVNTQITKLPYLKAAFPDGDKYAIFSDWLIVTDHVGRYYWMPILQQRYALLRQAGGKLYAWGSTMNNDYISQFTSAAYVSEFGTNAYDDLLKDIKKYNGHFTMNMARRVVDPGTKDYRPYVPLGL
jgi:hypothetical protein